MEKKQEKALHIVSLTREEFDMMVVKATEKTATEAAERCGGMAAFIVPMVGLIFAQELRGLLFQEEEANDDAANSAR